MQSPIEAAQRMAVQMKAVLDMTPEEHPDRKALEVGGWVPRVACCCARPTSIRYRTNRLTRSHLKTPQLATIMMEQTASGMQGALKDTQNYWRLVEIRESIASMELQASPLDTLVDANRKLVRGVVFFCACGILVVWIDRQIDGANTNKDHHLTVAADGGDAEQGVPLQGQVLPVPSLQRRPPLRHAGPSPCFLLFFPSHKLATHPGSHFSKPIRPPQQLPGGMLQFHRWMPLHEMNVAGSPQDKTGLDILTAEKSFTVGALFFPSDSCHII